MTVSARFLADSHVNRVGDKISVNIDLRLVDLQNLKLQQQQQQQNPDLEDWHSADPLDRHIRRMERSIDHVRGVRHRLVCQLVIFEVSSSDM